ncbi:MAG: hypothetical protein ABJG78_21515 [Cyclobacteriaceae bacterium]
MKRNILLTGLVFLCFAGFSQSKKFANDIKQALYIHDTASSAASEAVALSAFKDLTEKYPNEWLPSYWTAYLSTQVFRLKARPDFPKDLDPNEVLLDSKTYLEKSKTIKGEMTEREQSDFLMLEGFIYGFLKFSVPEEEEGPFVEQEKRKYQEAMKYNSRNPLMYVMKGITLLQEEDYQDIVAGIGLLDYAEQTFEKSENRGLTTYWNKDFIKFWRSRGEEKLKGLLEG